MGDMDYDLFVAYGAGNEDGEPANDSADFYGGTRRNMGTQIKDDEAVRNTDATSRNLWLTRDVHTVVAKKNSLGPQGLPVQSEKYQVSDGRFKVASPFFMGRSGQSSDTGEMADPEFPPGPNDTIPSERGKYPVKMLGNYPPGEDPMDGGGGVRCVPHYSLSGAVTATCAGDGDAEGAAGCAADCNPTSFPRIGEPLMANTPVTLISENDSAMCSVINGSGTYGKRAWLSASPERLGEVTTQCVGQLDAPLIVRFVNGTEIAPRAVKSGDRVVLLTTGGKQLAVIRNAQPGLPAVQLVEAGKSPSSFKIVNEAAAGAPVRVGDVVQLRVPTTTAAQPLFLVSGEGGMLTLGDGSAASRWRILGLPTFLSTVQLLKQNQAATAAMNTPPTAPTTETSDSKTKKAMKIALPIGIAALLLVLAGGIYVLKRRSAAAGSKLPFSVAAAPDMSTQVEGLPPLVVPLRTPVQPVTPLMSQQGPVAPLTTLPAPETFM